MTLADPLYGASFGEAVSRFFGRYFRFKGLSSRSEYWWSVLFQVLVAAVLGVIFVAFGGTTDAEGEISDVDTLSTGAIIVSIITTVVGLLLVIPYLSVTWRRLHDAGYAGPWYFIQLIPIVGWIILVILCILPTNPEKQKAKWDDPRRTAGI